MSAATVGGALRHAERRIDRSDARALLRCVVQRDSAYLISHADDSLTTEQQQRYDGLVTRRLAGEPVAYLVGEREFFGRVFKVTPSVLIPRPETELLVELALELIDPAFDAVVADLGTGSGCIAITLALERPRAQVLAVDRVADALAVAAENAKALGATNVKLVESDWFAALENAAFDMVVANPPYVARGDPHLSQGDLRFEPPLALAAGVDGLDSIRAILGRSRAHLRSGGWMLLEHGYDQAEAVRGLLEAGGYTHIFSARDLAGIERVSGGRLHG